jgi:hypothetical protein
MWYIRCYKIVYLIAILINLIMRFLNINILGGGHNAYGWIPYSINIFAILINSISFVMMEKGFRNYIVVEKLLSAIRMITIILIASIIFGSMVVLVIPTSFVLWYPILSLRPSREIIWLICIVLLVLEILYFRKLSKN